jgi:hypothetical protein
MKTDHDPLDRLLRSAARAGSGAYAEPPYGLESRVVTAWRAARADSETPWLVPWLRGAIALACLAVLLSGAWNHLAGDQASGDELTLADSPLQIALNQ